MTTWPHPALVAGEASADLELALRPLVAALAQALERVDPPMTPLQLRCLHELEVRAGATVGEVAAAVGAIPSTASRTVDRLVAAGLVSRLAHAEDRRQVALDLTPAGRRALAEVSEMRAAALAATVGRMDEPDRSALLRGVQAFARLHDGAAGPAVGQG